MKMISPLKLILPERAPAPEGSIFLDVGEIESWISHLPLANTGETSKQTFKTLVELNRLEIPNVTRVKIANLLRPVVRHVASSLSKYYIDVPVPLSAKNHKVVVLCRELHMELANSYKIIIERTTTGQEKKFDHKILIVALHQALHHLFKVLYYSVIAYIPYPGNTWQEIHQLYLFSEQNSVADIQINRGGNNSDSTCSIKDIYLNAMLLSLASPYGLRQKELEELFDNIDKWTKHILIKPFEPEDAIEGQFFVATDKDNPPIHIALREEEPGDFCYTINTASLVKHLQAELKKVYTNNEGGNIFNKEMQITAPLLRKLIKSLTFEPKRGFNRTNLNFKLDAVVGISDIHNQITTNRTKPVESEADLIAEIERNEEFKESSFLDSYFSANDTSIQIVPLDHPVDEVISQQQQFDSPIEDDGAPAWAKQKKDEKKDIFSCKTQNESAGGYCINWNGDDAPKIIVGEVIGIQSASDHSQFSVGIVRWLRHMPEVGLQLGFEIISPITDAVTIHTAANSRHPSTTHKCILLPKNVSANRPESLILPIINIQVGDEIEIEQSGAKRPAKLARLLESTGTFSQYELSYLDEDN
jgi:hypothetical protein